MDICRVELTRWGVESQLQQFGMEMGFWRWGFWAQWIQYAVPRSVVSIGFGARSIKLAEVMKPRADWHKFMRRKQGPRFPNDSRRTNNNRRLSVSNGYGHGYNGSVDPEQLLRYGAGIEH